MLCDYLIVLEFEQLFLYNSPMKEKTNAVIENLKSEWKNHGAGFFEEEMTLLEYLLERRDEPQVVDAYIDLIQLVDIEREIAYGIHLMSGGEKDLSERRSLRQIESHLRIEETKKSIIEVGITKKRLTQPDYGECLLELQHLINGVRQFWASEEGSNHDTKVGKERSEKYILASRLYDTAYFISDVLKEEKKESN